MSEQPPDSPSQTPLEAGERALADGEWGRATSLLSEAIENGSEPLPEAWESLGWASWWLGREQETFDARIQAFKLYRAAGDATRAAAVAAWIAVDTREFRGEEAAARGWMQRASTLLEGQQESPAHGWVAVLQADLALNFDRDSTGALQLCEQAARIGREFGISDLEAIGLAQGGCCHVAEGRIEEGMRSLDEAMTIASSEELNLPISEGWTLCCLIATCDGIGDFRRASEWCERTRLYTERWGGRQLIGLCRSSYGRVLATQGDWPAADVELTGAVDDLRGSRPGMAAGGLARLGELRARQGRDEEARELFKQAGAAGMIGLGDMELAEGRPDQAIALAQRALRALPDPAILDRLPPQELLVRALIESDRIPEAEAELETVRATATTIGTPYLAGRASRLAAEHALAAGEPDASRRLAEDAVDAFTASGSLYDIALARLGLTRALAALGWAEQAENERLAALSAFEEMGAARELHRASIPISVRSSVAPPGSEATDELGALTRRELEVLRLIASGSADAQIAVELVISVHTVHRHVANIRNKLGLSSRAAAVAYAARSGLL